MRKINARVKPAEKKEVGKIAKRRFKCKRCTCVTYLENVEFGEEVRCPECGGKMYELLEDGQKQTADSDGAQ